MRHAWVLVALVLVAGCKRREMEGFDDHTADEVQTLLGCPPGTDEIGGLPPSGLDLWCARTDETGVRLRHGPARAWWPDGRPKEAGAYADDQRTGHWWFWDADGRLLKEGDFRDGRETGWWMVYRPDGTVSEEGPMMDGGREGVWTVYDAKTGIPIEGPWVAGEKDGLWVEYDADGKPLREREYRRGRLVSQREL
jgi:hypothetical protein